MMFLICSRQLSAVSGQPFRLFNMILHSCSLLISENRSEHSCCDSVF
jgi:hypothetical protein